MRGNVLAGGDWPGDRRDWMMWGGEMRGTGARRAHDVGGMRRLGGVGLAAPFSPEFTSGAVVPETVPPLIIDKLGGAGLVGAGGE